MYKEVLKCLSTNCRLYFFVSAICGICVIGLSGCSNSESLDQHNETCESGECEQTENDSSAYSRHDDVFKHDNNILYEHDNDTDATGCGRCKDYEVCLEGRCLCEPSCDGKAIKADGCGGQCACPEDKVANEQLLCVDPSECSGSCETAGWACGEICGVSCGQCGTNHRCESGYCVCEPVCDGTRCDDGCGGQCPCDTGTVCNHEGDCVPTEECDDTCEAAQYACGSICGDICGTCAETESCLEHKCEVAVNCQDCSLKLSLAEKVINNGRIEAVTLALDYEPTDSEPKPRMFDIRLKADSGVSLDNLTVGDALQKAEKDLYTDPDSNKKWQERADGTYRFVAFSVDDNREIEKGRLMTLNFKVNVDSVAMFSLVEKLQIFAPPIADEALQLSSYAEIVKVTQ